MFMFLSINAVCMYVCVLSIHMHLCVSEPFCITVFTVRAAAPLPHIARDARGANLATPPHVRPASTEWVQRYKHSVSVLIYIPLQWVSMYFANISIHWSIFSSICPFVHVFVSMYMWSSGNRTGPTYTNNVYVRLSMCICGMYVCVYFVYSYVSIRLWTVLYNCDYFQSYCATTPHRTPYQWCQSCYATSRSTCFHGVSTTKQI